MYLLGIFIYPTWQTVVDTVLPGTTPPLPATHHPHYLIIYAAQHSPVWDKWHFCKAMTEHGYWNVYIEMLLLGANKKKE